jgi:hypothetical protein
MKAKRGHLWGLLIGIVLYELYHRQAGGMGG